MEEYVLYRWESTPNWKPQYIVVDAETWDKRVWLADNRGSNFNRLELARGARELMYKMKQLTEE